MKKQPAARLWKAGITGKFSTTLLSLVVLCTAQGCGEKGNPTTPGTVGTSAAGSPETAGKSAKPDVQGCVYPTAETIAAGSYSLSRPLFVYVNKKSLDKPHVAAFLRFYLYDGQAIVNEVQSVALPEATLKESQQALEAVVPAASSEALSGTIRVDGSSTVYLISQAVGEEFNNKHKDVQVEVGKSGTGGGFKRFATGDIDISDASRPITEKESAHCKEHGVEYVSFTVAIDGISVVVSKENDWCNCITVEQLKKAWEPDSKVKNWSDIDPLWPEKEIGLYGADTDSGTFDFFTEAIVGKAKASRSDYTASGDDNQLVVGVQGNRYALGYIPFAYYVENKDGLKALGIVPAAKPAAGEKP